MKILKFLVQNYKSIRGTQEFVPNGSSFFLIGGNGVGKTSVGHALMDMLTKSLPSKPITEGEKTGYVEFTFTNGSKFLGRFVDGKKPQLEFITPEGYNVGSPKELLQKLTGEGMDFNIDDMLKMSPAPLRKKLEAIAGIDLTDLNLRYKMKYDERALANAKLRDQQGRIEPYEMKFAVMDPVQASTVINRIQEMNHNQTLWTNEETRIKDLTEKLVSKTKEIHDANYALEMAIPEKLNEINQNYENEAAKLKAAFERNMQILLENKRDSVEKHELGVKKEQERIAQLNNELATLEASKTAPSTLPERPAQHDIDALQLELTNLEETNRKIEHAKKMHSEFMYFEELEKLAKSLDQEVDQLIAEKESKIKASPLPARGLEFDQDGNLTIDGFPFEDNQISAARKLIAGIEIASSMLGDIKYLHIDGAVLDHASADYVLEFAESKGLQLCIERPEWDGGELKMEIVDLTGPIAPIGDTIAPDANTIAPDAEEIAPHVIVMADDAEEIAQDANELERLAHNATGEPKVEAPPVSDPTAQQPE